MASPFKMQPKSPMMKALVGKQGNLPQHLQDAIKAAPETKSKKDSPMKSYGSKKKSPMMKDSKKPMTAEEIKKNKETMDYRRGRGRADVTKKGSMVKGSEGRRLGEGMSPTGSKKAGSAGRRSIKEGTTASGRRTGRSMTVVLEKPASKIKARGIDLENKKAKGKSPAMMKGVKGLKMQRGKK